MEYTEKEKQILTVLQRTDFKNLSKNDLLSFASKLSEMRPEVASQVIAQFPEFAKLLHSALIEYKEMLGKVIESDNASIQEVYNTANKELDSAAQSRVHFYDLADKVRSDLSKCLDNPDMSPEQQKEIRDQEMEILRMAGEKDSEIREQELEMAHVVDKKDSEKRAFNWKLIGTVSGVLVAVVGVAAGALGGDFNLRLPGKGDDIGKLT